MLEQRIEQHFIDSADLKYQAAQVLSKPIAAAVSAVLASVTSGGKVLACGNGGSAADAQEQGRRADPHLLGGRQGAEPAVGPGEWCGDGGVEWRVHVHAGGELQRGDELHVHAGGQ